MCRFSAEMFAVTGGGSIFATAVAFAKAHWDGIRDRKAFRKGKERERENNDRSSDIQDAGRLD